jgi:hypothetical protein
MIKLISITTIIFLTFSGCSQRVCQNPKASYNESGKIWTSEPYLRKRDKPFDLTHLTVATKGYIYALAGTLALQKNTNTNDNHFFIAPKRLKLIDSPPRDSSGFEVKTFELYPKDTRIKEIKEIIIAFTGSNDSKDWFLTNLLFSHKQFTLAKKYVKKIHLKYPNKPIVVTGYSLGAALAIHVTKHNETSSLISEAWAFNPSPKTYVHGKEDKRIWVASTKSEMLKGIRKWYLNFLPGIAKIGAPKNQTATNYYLVKSNPIHSHFRWVLTREMLHVADFHIHKTTQSENTEPLNILKASRFITCQQSE